MRLNNDASCLASQQFELHLNCRLRIHSKLSSQEAQALKTPILRELGR